jgi:hypothetical protein
MVIGIGMKSDRHPHLTGISDPRLLFKNAIDQSECARHRLLLTATVRLKHEER